MKKISKILLIKHKKEILELLRLGKQYDNETDSEKKELLKDEIIKRCNDLKPKLKLTDCSDEEAQSLLGLSGELSSGDAAAKKTPVIEADDTNIS